ncbi:hypothetical protein [Christiangramia aquimixticola]|uniref:hypothetical protein n=1 Tax=Christiangramia aquimixticola TaxID=1697558 RepID=UPI003AA98A24
MKKMNFYLVLCTVFTLILTGCSKDETGEIATPDSSNVAVLQLGPVLNSPEASSALKQQETPECSDATPGFAQLSIIYGPNNIVKEDIIVPILKDGQGYFTAYSDELELPIPAGMNKISVTLTEFVVWTNNGGSPGSVIWVAPVEGSEFEDFVDQPVGPDFTFDLRAGSKNYINVDVICYDNRDVNRYGYQFFTITPVPLVKFCLFGNYCTPEGRHYVASYNAEIWEYNNGQIGDIIYNDTNDIDGEGSQAAADPLCFFLPDHPNQDENEDVFYLKITLLSGTPGYNGPDKVIAEGPFSVAEIKLLFGTDQFGEDNGTVDYYHFQYGCDNGVPPPFGEPTTKRYKACIKYLDGSDDVAGFAYLSVEGTTMQAVTSVFGLTPNKTHKQHIHQNASCGNYGPAVLALDYNDNTWPLANMQQGVSFMNYAEVISGVTLSNLQDRTVVVHGKMMGQTYDPDQPVACGEFSQY